MMTLLLCCRDCCVRLVELHDNHQRDVDFII
jgi:hypothetical protein